MTTTAKSTVAHSVFRITVAAISSGAALVSILSFARTYGLLGSSSPVHLTVGDIGASWVGISPTADTVTALGDTIHLAATVTDKSGSVLVGAALVWSSDNTHVASVGADGTVISRGPGTTSIVAAVGDRLARSRITVKQVVSAVKINGDSTITMNDGDQAPLIARALDARGSPVPQRTAKWQTANSEVLSIDSLGIATAKNPGSTTVGATVDGVTSYVPAKVVAVPAALGLVAGGDQRASAGSALPQRVVVRVLSRRGRPVVGAAVRFRAEDGAGSPDPAVASTDDDGRVRALWTLGALPGRQHLFISVDHVDSALVVQAEAEPVAANTRAAQIGAPPSAVAGTALAEEVGVRLTDSTGRALADVQLSWAALDGGSVTHSAARTDTLGEARARWTLGSGSGPQRMRVQIGNGRAVPPVTLSAIAIAGPPVTAAIIVGDAQKSTVNALLHKPIVLRVADKLGNPVPGARVSLATETGTLADSVAITDSTGTVTVKWTMARLVGKQRLVAHVDGIERKIEATAVALPASAANLSLVTDVMSGMVGKVLGTPVVATVTDSYGNPVADAVVSFSARSGGASPARVSTDAKGHAQTRWTLGRTPGEQALVAVVKDADVRGTITVQATTTETAARVTKPAPTKSLKPVVPKSVKPAVSKSTKKSTKRSE
ncbi:MAG TPA: Ig-like domain-containing protein [Gemmatimonadaceae bacterium]|jgi:hypothetical protein|nr:Ig-like domain-containing protein [Gemmatimonadaceae bacterium]